MARPQNRKRHCADEAVQDNPSAKRLRADAADQDDRTAKRKRPHTDQPSQVRKKVKTGEDNFSPAFWDSLSKVWLTPRALRELDRRNNARPRPGFTGPEVCSKNLARFARRGGPDLRHLRGYPEPANATRTMASSNSSASTGRQTQSTNATSISSRSRKSSAYDKDFEQHLTDHGIYLNNRKSGPGNLDEIRTQLAQDRPSLSPSRFSDGAFEDFREKNDSVVFEKDVMTKIIPLLCGNADIPNQQDVLFTELKALTSNEAARPKPDFFDGAPLKDIHGRVRDKNDKDNVYSTTIPTKHPRVPVAPNYFLEVKGPEGSAAVLRRQACYDGAYGARAMHSLQNYGEEEPTYDGEAHTFSSTYHAGTGTLQLYAHHTTEPKGDRPEYHMTKVRGFDMTDSRETFIHGATAFRNARDLAKQRRDSFIREANARASEAGTVATELAATRVDEDSLVDDADCIAMREADEALQRQIADSYASQDKEDTYAIPRYLSAEDDSQELSPEFIAPRSDDPSISSATSFTSGFSTRTVRSKRPGQSLSPPLASKRTHSSTSRTPTESSTGARESARSGSSEST